MPRQARLVVDGGCYHVLTRGNNRATVFHDPADFQRYGQLVATYFPAQQIRLAHYCLMSNHVHLIVEAATGQGLRTAMHGLNLSYALAYKRRYGHTGHFWQDRFKSLLIDRDSYLLQCGAYVELNPVRARLVTSPEAYPWSSYRTYAQGARDALVTPNPLYETLGTTAAERQVRYRAFVQAQVDPPPNWHRHRALGSPTFLQALAGRVQGPVLMRAPGRPRQLIPAALHEK